MAGWQYQEEHPALKNLIPVMSRSSLHGTGERRCEEEQMDGASPGKAAVKVK